MQALQTALKNTGITVTILPPLPPAEVWHIPGEAWGQAAGVARSLGLRWSAGWGEELEETFRVNTLLAQQGRYLLLRTEVPRDNPELPSQAGYYPAADRSERHTRDLLGIRFSGGDRRRWIRHQAWREDEHPLRRDFPACGRLPGETPPDVDYPFLQAQGAGVYEIPVGPVHAGIIEPGHFRFQAVGETILNLEEHLGYVHKGIEKLALSRDMAGLARLAGRISGDTTVGHTWAACMAMEQAAGQRIPGRAAYLRAILAERERIANHLGDMAAILNDIAFTFGYYQFGRLREDWLRANQTIFGHRLLMDLVVPGGVAVDLDAAAVRHLDQGLDYLRRELDELITIVDRNASVNDRLYTTGILKVEDAAGLGCLGYVGLASGQDFDVRRDCPYSPYDQLTLKVPAEEGCDVGARFWVRYKEVRSAMRLLRVLQGRLLEGPVRAELPEPGLKTESVHKILRDPEVERLGVEVKRQIDQRFAGSLAIREVDAGSCNGCELELHALNNVYYDVERFGVHFVASPRHADVLLVTGPVSRHMEAALKRTFDATPDPKWVIACGDCAVCGGEFGVSYASLGAVENVLPVDVKIPGCPPTPAQLLVGILQAVSPKLERSAS